jgi:NAD(P)-dependent dehydrogenase (short-subunit alcohol dehydrogenase family)
MPVARQSRVRSASGALFVRCDVGSAADVDAAFAAVAQRLGACDFLVNNAGIQHYGTVTDTPEEEWDRVMAVNLKSAYLVRAPRDPDDARARLPAWW